MKFHPARLNQIKRDGGALTTAQIDDLVQGVVDGSLDDAQLGAFLMAVCLVGMTTEETTALTLAMRDSGAVIDLSSVPGIKVDKHSTGGVGDKVSLVLAPLMAACGVPVPMVSGRGLGHTGGTIDKLAAIPGYRTDLTQDEYVSVLQQCGFVMAAAGAWLAPADARMYRTRDVTGTVESIPLITASILSKKLSEGIDGLVIDVKCGRAAFMKSKAQAEALMHSLVATGRAAGKQVSALMTDMDQPLGLSVGNALEVVEAIECLAGRGPSDLRETTVALGIEMLLLAQGEQDPGVARTRLEHVLDRGMALPFLQRNIFRQGGDGRIVDAPDLLPRAPVVCPVLFEDPEDGETFVVDLDPMEIGLAAMDLGAGRRQSKDIIDPAVGIVLARKPGDRVQADEPLAWLHARGEASVQDVAKRVRSAFRFGSERKKTSPSVLTRVV